MPVPESTLILKEQLAQARHEIFILRERLRQLPKVRIGEVKQMRPMGYVLLPVLDVQMTSEACVFNVIVGGAS